MSHQVCHVNDSDAIVCVKSRDLLARRDAQPVLQVGRVAVVQALHTRTNRQDAAVDQSKDAAADLEPAQGIVTLTALSVLPSIQHCQY